MIEWYINFNYFIEIVYNSGIRDKYRAYTAAAIADFAEANNCEMITKAGLMRCDEETLTLIRLRYSNIVHRMNNDKIIDYDSILANKQ